jgi:hypothetical protein
MDLRRFFPTGGAGAAFLAAFLGLFSLGHSGLGRAEDGAEAAAEAAATLVERLGDPSYEVRQGATEELAKLGSAALDALRDGLRHADPEVRRRCRWLLADALEADHQRRIDAFLADEAGGQEHNLPGWDRYRRIVGDSRAARELFRDMQHAEQGLLASAAAGPAAAAEALRLRLTQMQQVESKLPEGSRRHAASAATVAALLLVCSDRDLQLPDEVALNNYIVAVVEQDEFRRLLREASEGRREAAQRLLGQWILQPGGQHTYYVKLALSIRYDIPEGLHLARGALRDKSLDHGETRALAVRAVGRLGGLPHADVLAGLLDDESVVHQGKVGVGDQRAGNTYHVEMRDFALRWLVELTGQDHADYGRPEAKREFEMVGLNPYQWNFYVLRFENDREREAALQKWADYVAAHPLPDLPLEFDLDAQAAVVSVDRAEAGDETARAGKGARGQTGAKGEEGEKGEKAAGQAASLVERLGDPSYEVRHGAAEELAKLGLAALDELRDGLRHADPEVRRRCRWVLADVLEADYQRRLDAFLADESGEQEHDIPGWDRYRRIVGNSRAARELFRDMQRAERGLLISAAAGPVPAAESLSLRLTQVQRMMSVPRQGQRTMPSAATVAAILFVCSDRTLRLPENLTESHYVTNLVQQEPFRKLLTEGEDESQLPARRLVGQWILRPGGQSSLHTKLSLSIQYDIPEGLHVARRMLGDKSIPHGHFRALAVGAVGRLGGLPYAGVLADLLADESVCYQGTIAVEVDGKRVTRQIRTQVRDVALRWLVELTGKDHADYGRPEAKQEFERIAKTKGYHGNFYQLGFESDEDREAALKKWAEYVAEHPLPEAPPEIDPDALEAAAAADGTKPADEKPADGKPAGEEPAEPKPAPERPRGDDAAPPPAAVAVPVPVMVVAAAAPAVAAPAPEAEAADQQDDDAAKKADAAEREKEKERQKEDAEKAKAAQAQAAGARVVVGGGAIVVGAAQAAVGNAPKAGEKEDEKEPGPRGLCLLVADRDMVQNLILAQELIRRKQYAKGTELLDRILAAEGDYAYQPERQVGLWRCLKAEAERILGELPDEGMAAYRLQFEPLAEVMLREAAATGAPERLARVVERFFHTRAGAEAAYILAIDQFNRGHPLHAALRLARIRRDARDAERFEPSLGLALASCWHLCGMPREAEAALGEMLAARGGKSVALGGATRQLDDGEEARRWLASLIGPPRRAMVEEGWPMARGGPDRNRTSRLGGAYVAGRPLAPFGRDAAVQRKIDELDQKHREAYEVAMPASSPLVVEGSIVFRTATHLIAIDFESGATRWEAPLEDALQHYLGASHRDLAQVESDEFQQALRRRVFEDLSFGALSSDGQSVFSVEDLSFGFGPDYQRIHVTPDGRQRLDGGSLKQYNLLTAYELATGKLLWEIGGSPEIDGAELAGAYFLGPPLPLGGRLYAVAEVDQQTRLLELDAESGRLLSSLTLVLRDEAPQRQVFTPFGVAQNIRQPSRNGVSPAYSDGVLVCQAGDDQFVAVDMSTRGVLWVYQAPEKEFGSRRQMQMILRQQALQGAEEDQANRWADQGVMIADGHVLLAVPGAEELVCIGLDDGQWRWSAPRRDGLYVGGAADGKAVVVGRGGVWALRLADGSPAWPHDRVALPAGALPSGRGYLGEDRYHVPLSTGEIAAVGLRAGRLVARSRSPSGIVPGNLVACRDAVLSQSPQGLWRFETLAQRDRHLAEALEKRPDDAALLARRGEVLACEGRLDEAVRLLRESIERRPDADARRMLADAMMDGLGASFDAFEAMAGEVDAMLRDAEHRPQFLRQMAQGLLESGRTEAAFDIYLRLIDAETKPGEMERFEAARAVRRDRWLAARLAEVYRGAPAEAAASLDRRIEERLAADEPEKALAYLGWHPAAAEVRLRRAVVELLAGDQALEAEQMLLRVLGEGKPHQRREAVARLALLMRDAGRPEAAARYYRHLGAELADEVCLDGKTGREMVEALPEDDPVRLAMSPASPWPAGKVRVEADEKQARQTYAASIFVGSDGGPFDAEPTVEMDMQSRKMVGYDRFGRTAWEIEVAAEDANWQIAMGYGRSGEAWLAGHLMFVWLGNRVGAVDLLADKPAILWRQQAFEGNQRATARVFWGGMPAQPNPMRAAEAMPMVAGASQLTYIQDRKLRALGATSGEPLWMRDDVEPGSTLLGDGEVLLVAAEDSDEAVVFSADDGRELGRRRIPPTKEHVARFGRRVLVWRAQGDAQELALVDPWVQEVLWRHVFPPKSQPWPMGNREIAVFEPQGQLTIIALPSGQPVLQSQLDAEPALDGIFVTTALDRYIVAVNRPGTQQGQMVFMHAYASNVPVNGRVYGLERTTGNVAWATEIENQSMRHDHPRGLPVVALLNFWQVVKDNRVQATAQLMVLDSRDGRLLHQQQRQQPSAHFHRWTGDPENNQAELHTFIGTVKLTFTDDDPAAPDPEPTAEGAEPKSEANEAEKAAKEAAKEAVVPAPAVQ